MKGLYQRGKVWWLRYSAGGKQYFETLGTQDESEAITKAAEILDSPERIPARSWDSEVTAYLKGRVDARKMSANASASRKTVFDAFARDEEIREPGQVTPAVVKRWYKALQTRIEETTAQTYIRWLRTFCETLVDARKLRSNPVDGLEVKELRKAKRKPFCTAGEVRRLIDECQDDELRFILFAGFHCGLRREEIVEARPEWFDLENGILHIQRSDTWEPKDRDDRPVPMTKEFVAFVRKFGLRKPFMIEPKKVKKGRWRYRYDFRRPFDLYMASKGMEWVTPHTMRRTFASLKVSAGVSLYKVAVWLGDLERVVQDHYGFLLPKDSDIERGILQQPSNGSP